MTMTKILKLWDEAWVDRCEDNNISDHDDGQINQYDRKECMMCDVYEGGIDKR